MHLCFVPVIWDNLPFWVTSTIALKKIINIESNSIKIQGWRKIIAWKSKLFDKQMVACIQNINSLQWVDMWRYLYARIEKVYLIYNSTIVTFLSFLRCFPRIRQATGRTSFPKVVFVLESQKMVRRSWIFQSKTLWLYNVFLQICAHVFRKTCWT